MAVLVGGGCDGWVYYDSDLVERERVAGRVGQRFDYVRTAELRPHPEHVEFLCQVWEYRRPPRRSGSVSRLGVRS